MRLMKKRRIILLKVCIFLLFSFSAKAQIIQHRIDSLQHLIQQVTNDSLKADLLNEEARYFLRLRNYKKADSIFNTAAEISGHAHYAYGLFTAYLLKSKGYTGAYNFKDALSQLLKAQKLLS